MLERVILQGFRGVRHMELPLQRVTALLGPNSSGKTTALHAVRMACGLLERAIQNDDAISVIQRDGAPWISVTEGALFTDGAQQLSLADWQALFLDQNVPNNTTASIELIFGDADPIQAVEVSLRCGNNAQIKLDVNVRADEATALVAEMPKKSKRVSQTLTQWLRDRAPRAVFVPPFYGTVASEELRSRAVIDRLLGAGDQSHVVRNLVTSLTNDQFLQLSAFLDAVVGARLVDRTSGDALQAEPTLRVMFTDSNGPIELSAAGAGLINLVALYAALARWGGEASRRAVIFLIDEPEAHLSPMVQADSASRVARLVTQEFRAQLVLATHSVDILNRLHRERAQLVRCDRKNTARPTQVLSDDAGLFSDLASWADLTPYTAINFLASRRVLFIEGKTERELLPILGALRARNGTDGRRALERWAIVAIDGSANVNQPRLLKRLFQSQALQERVRGTPLEVIVVLDRDYERTAGWGGEEEQDGVRYAELVWPVHSVESLFTRPQVLRLWVRAWLRDAAPPDLDALIAEAITAADADPALRHAALAALTGSGIASALRAGASLLADYGRVIKDISEEASRRVEADPASWQHGKDRARVILGKIREGLPPAARGQFPTTVTSLIQGADLSRIGFGQDALPSEVLDLLDRMMRP